MSAKGKIAKTAGAMSTATFISRILGFAKDIILAKVFGATGAADVFFIAYRIPNLLRELFAEGSMSSAFIPVLTQYQTKHGRDEANRLVRSAFIFILIFAGITCVLGIVFAPAIVSIIAPGFLNDPEKFSDTVLLTKIMFPFLLFVSLAALVMGALNTRGVFFIPALAPAALNIVIITSIITLSMHFANPIVAVAIGVTAGGLAQFLFQLPSFFKKGYTLKAKSKGVRSQESGVRSQNKEQRTKDREQRATEAEGDDTEYITAKTKAGIWHPALKRIGLLIIPATLGMAVVQVNVLVSTALASFLPEGSITYLYYSMRLIQFPIGMFGVAMGMAVLPALSEHSVKGEMNKLKEDFSFALRLLFFLTVPALAGLIALRVPIVSTLFQRGAFDYTATIGTSDALMFYSLGIWAIVGVKIVTVTFYSMQDTKTPVKIAAAAMLVNILLSLLLMGPMKHNGLALAVAISSCFNFVLLFYFLRKKIGAIGTKKIATSFVKTFLASAVMGASGWFIVKNEIWELSGYDIQKAIHLGTAIMICIGIYILLSYIIKNEEMGYIIKKIKNAKASWR